MVLGYSSMTAGVYDLDEAFAVADRLGLGFVELSHDVDFFLPGAQPVRRVLELKQATGVAVTLHLPFIDLNLASLIGPVRRTAVAQTQAGLDYAEAIGALCAVAHTGTLFVHQPRSTSDSLAALLESLSEVSPGPVPLLLENLALYPDAVLHGPAMLDAVTRQAGLANCLDFAHAFIECRKTCCANAPNGDLIEGYIATLGDNITHLHLCNTDGLSDLHTATPDGALDYGRYRPFLSGFGGTVCLEVSGGERGVARSAAQIRALSSVLA